jgi:trk system potassium uptake protein TrkA
VVVVGAGHVGHTVVESLHADHDCTVVDLDEARLRALSQTYDVRVVQGDGAGRQTLLDAGVADADLLLACTPRDEVNLVTAILGRRLSSARTIVRTTDMGYLDAWRDGDLDVDFMISTEFETANAVARVVGVPGTRQADFFLGGAVQVLEFDVAREDPPAFAGTPLEDAALPPDSRVAAVVRDGEHIVPGGRTELTPGDRVVVITSSGAAREWSRLLLGGDRVLNDVVLFGGGRVGEAVARVLLDRGIRVRLIERDAARAAKLADALPKARVYHATGLEEEFLRRERIGQATAAVAAMHDDARNLYAAVLAKVHGVPETIAILDQPESDRVFDAAGVDAVIDPGAETAEVIVRFAHDPRTRQIAMVEEDRFKVLDITVREDSALANRPLAELAQTTSVVGAVQRDGELLFPHGDQDLHVGDRVIVLTESAETGSVERAL